MENRNGLMISRLINIAAILFFIYGVIYIPYTVLSTGMFILFVVLWFFISWSLKLLYNFIINLYGIKNLDKLKKSQQNNKILFWGSLNIIFRDKLLPVIVVFLLWIVFSIY